jgi:hypothetical protein
LWKTSKLLCEALPFDVRKGFALPFWIVSELCNSEAQPRYRQKKTLPTGKPEAFRTSGGRASINCSIEKQKGLPVYPEGLGLCHLGFINSKFPA